MLVAVDLVQQALRKVVGSRQPLASDANRWHQMPGAPTQRISIFM
jgi:hypothetical protein